MTHQAFYSQRAFYSQWVHVGFLFLTWWCSSIGKLVVFVEIFAIYCEHNCCAFNLASSLSKMKSHLRGDCWKKKYLFSVKIALCETIPILSCFKQNGMCFVFVYCAFILMYYAQLVFATLARYPYQIMYFKVFWGDSLSLFK